MDPHWYQRVTEAGWFKKALNPQAKGMGGHLARGVTTAFAAVAITLTAQGGWSADRDCQANALRHVYKPSRLEVLGKCQEIDVVVQKATKERDGDYHIQGKTDRKWLGPANYAKQNGNLVVEYMPGDPFPRPKKGDRLRLLATWTADHEHGWRDPKTQKVHYWREAHPVFNATPIAGTEERPVP